MRQLLRLVLGMGIGLLSFFSLMALSGYIFARWLFRQASLRDYIPPVVAARKRYGRKSQEYQDSLKRFHQQVRAAQLRAAGAQPEQQG